MQISQKGLDLIRHFEGFSATPYLCPANVWTNGYGHTKGVTATTPPVTQAIAEANLFADVQWASDSVQRLIGKCNQSQFDALVSFTFNLGGGALQRSTLRRKFNRGDHKGAADAFLSWIIAGGRKNKGLLLRRQAERKLFLSEG